MPCPTRSGTWVAALLTYGLHLAPGPTRVLMAMTGAAGVAELQGAATEALSLIGADTRQPSRLTDR